MVDEWRPKSGGSSSAPPTSINVGASSRSSLWADPGMSSRADVHTRGEMEGMAALNVRVDGIHHDVRDIRQALAQLVPKVAEIHSQLPHLAKREDLAGKVGWGGLALAITTVLAVLVLLWGVATHLAGSVPLTLDSDTSSASPSHQQSHQQSDLRLSPSGGSSGIHALADSEKDASR